MPRREDDMKLLAVIVGVLFVVVVGAGQQKPAGTELDGAWTLQSMERNGNPMPQIPQASITFKGDQALMKGFQQTPTGDEVAYTYAVDTKATPKALTMKRESTVISSVYELNGDTLRLILGRPGAERPAKVSSENNVLLTLKRTK